MTQDKQTELQKKIVDIIEDNVENGFVDVIDYHYDKSANEIIELFNIQQPTIEAIQKMADKECVCKEKDCSHKKSFIKGFTSALGYAGDNWIERVKVLEDALKDAVEYEEGCRKTMCEVNKEFDMNEPKELAWVIKAKQVLQS